MQARIQKWGDGLALCIPSAVALDAGLAEDTMVDLSLVEGKLIVEPVAPEKPTLADLLRRVTPENIHKEEDTGPPVGKEIW